MNLIRKNRIQKGFTLIELLVVISIIGILAAFAIASFSSAQARGRDAKRKNDLDQIKKALQMYYNDNNTYPDPTGCDWSIAPCWSTLLGTQYIKVMPKDPKNLDLGGCDITPNCYLYHYCRLSASSYVFIANLENANDPQKQSSNTSGCAHAGPNWYWITNP